jgi:hypothetical protein
MDLIGSPWIGRLRRHDTLGGASSGNTFAANHTRARRRLQRDEFDNGLPKIERLLSSDLLAIPSVGVSSIVALSPIARRGRG